MQAGLQARAGHQLHLALNYPYKFEISITHKNWKNQQNIVQLLL